MKHCAGLLMLVLLAASAFGQDAPRRELRAAWIATVYNIDWPSRSGLPVETQRAELSAMLDTLARLNFNAVIVQVKPSSDAFYASKISPWSRFLTGVQGQDPGYDPLEFLIAEARLRSLEVHAWINPFRISNGEKLESLSPAHGARKNPGWVIEYGGKFYFDPGNPSVRAHVQNEILEIVRNYDVDAIHMDDYFYPYRVSNLPFGDGVSYEKYGAGQALDDWRRSNTERFVEGTAAAVKKEKPHVQIGISPFGVWRNGDRDPRGSRTKAGQTNYDDLFADILAWVDRGFVDYLMPQLYWNFTTPNAEFDMLTDWWSQAVGGKTKLYPGLAAYRLGEGWAPEVLKSQADYLRRDSKVGGMAFFSAKWIHQNTKGVQETLKQVFAKPALIPASDSNAPPAPRPLLSGGLLQWKPVDAARSYAVYGGPKQRELLAVLPASTLSYPAREGWSYALSSLGRGHAESPLTEAKDQKVEASAENKTNSPAKPAEKPLAPSAPARLPSISRPSVPKPAAPRGAEKPRKPGQEEPPAPPAPLENGLTKDILDILEVLSNRENKIEDSRD